MLDKIKYIVLTIFLLLPALVSAADDGGRIILDLQEDEPVAEYDVPALYQEYLQELDYFDNKYSGADIYENFTDDVAALHPDYTTKQAQARAGFLRLSVRARRTYRFLQHELQEFMLKNDIPLRFADEEYEMGQPEEYQPTDKPLVIKKFKKAIAYSDSPQDQAAIADKLARDAGCVTPYERKQLLKKALLRRDWKTLISYGLFDGKDFEDKRGVGEWVKTPELQARLLTRSKNLGGEVKVSGALQLYIVPGWFLLEREYQGHSGVKTDFTASANLQDIRLNWPLPKRYYSRRQSFAGYVGLITIPFDLDIADSAQPLQLRSLVNANLCNDAQGCRNVVLRPQLELLSGTAEEPSRVAVALDLLQNQAPKYPNSKLRLKRLVVEDGKIPVLRLEAEAARKADKFDAFIEGEGPEEFAPPLVSLNGADIEARFVPYRGDADLVGRKFTISAGIAGDISTRQELTAESESLAQASRGGFSLRLLWWALAGGLLLNFVSGAFSVLALRIISLLQFGAPDTAQVRRDFAANVAGIMTAAALLLGIILSAKHFGCAVGWGMQFAWLGFIVFMFLIVFTLISVWRGQLPSLTIGCDIISPAKRRLILQFGCGVLAVSLALFCPSLYIKAAFSQVLPASSIEIAVIMFLAALGLSAPYLLFVAVPSMACYMPFPGRWLRGLKKLALLALWLTLGWLALLLALQCSAGILWRLALLLVVLRLMLYFRRLVFESLDETSSEPQICRIVSLTLNIITVACLLALFGLGWRWADSLADIRSDEFNQKKLQTLVQQGETVLLKVEADWCLACRYNDFVAFEAPQVQKLLADKRIAVITVNKGQYNPELVRLMQKFGRHNIPFYMVFAPNLPDGVALPRFPTELDLRNIFEYLKP